MLQQKEHARTGCKRSQTASAPDWTKGTKKAPSEALRCGIPVPPPAQSAGAVGDSGPQYPGGLKGPLRQLQEFSGPLHLLLNEGVSDLFGFQEVLNGLGYVIHRDALLRAHLAQFLGAFFLGGMTGRRYDQNHQSNRERAIPMS